MHSAVVRQQGLQDSGDFVCCAAAKCPCPGILLLLTRACKCHPSPHIDEILLKIFAVDVAQRKKLYSQTADEVGSDLPISLMSWNCSFELCLQRFTMHLTNVNRSGNYAALFIKCLNFPDVEVSYSSMTVTTHGSHDFYWQVVEAAL